MKNRGWIVGASLFGGLVIGMGFYTQVNRLRQDQRRELWLAYVRGPLNLYVHGSREGVMLLRSDGRSVRYRGRFDHALRSLDRSTMLVTQEQGYFDADAFFDDLDQAVAWHHAASQGAQSWPKLRLQNTRDVLSAQRSAEEIRRALSAKVAAQWGRGEDEWSLSSAEKTESVVMLGALATPLP